MRSGCRCEPDDSITRTADRPDVPVSAIVRVPAESARRMLVDLAVWWRWRCAVVDRCAKRMSPSGVTREPTPADAGDQRPPSVTFSQTMARLRAPSRSLVLRDYLDDVAVSETQARAWREQAVMLNAREHLSNEARWLRGRGALTDDERRALLDGLGSRLHDLAHHLKARTVPTCLYSTLTALAGVIDARGDVDRVWNETLGVLDAFVAEGNPPRARR